MTSTLFACFTQPFYLDELGWVDSLLKSALSMSDISSINICCCIRFTSSTHWLQAAKIWLQGKHGNLDVCADHADRHPAPSVHTPSHHLVAGLTQPVGVPTSSRLHLVSSPLCPPVGLCSGQIPEANFHRDQGSWRHTQCLCQSAGKLLFSYNYLQRLAKGYAGYVKQDPSWARQSSLETTRTHFIQPCTSL